jgi:hypothetical protein
MTDLAGSAVATGVTHPHFAAASGERWAIRAACCFKRSNWRSPSGGFSSGWQHWGANPVHGADAPLAAGDDPNVSLQ